MHGPRVQAERKLRSGAGCYTGGGFCKSLSEEDSNTSMSSGTGPLRVKGALYKGASRANWGKEDRLKKEGGGSRCGGGGGEGC